MSLLTVVVQDTEINTRSGISARNNKPWTLRIQENVFVDLNGEIRRMSVTLPDNKPPYPPGKYTLDVVSLLQMGGFNRLEINGYSEIKLVPVAVSAVPNMNKQANG